MFTLFEEHIFLQKNETVKLRGGSNPFIAAQHDAPSFLKLTCRGFARWKFFAANLSARSMVLDRLEDDVTE